MRLHRLDYSCYARFVQATLELAKVPFELVDVRYGDREELAKLTGGYIQVPVLELDDGTPIVDSRRIAQHLVSTDERVARLVPDADAALVWAYVDFANGPVEDAAFRLASPGIAQRFESAFERALFVFSKERKFIGSALTRGPMVSRNRSAARTASASPRTIPLQTGAGSVDAWERDADALFEQLVAVLEPTTRTLAHRPFLIGREPTLADLALLSQLLMLDLGAPDRVAQLVLRFDVLRAWRERLEARLGPPPYGRVAARHRDEPEMLEALASAPAPSGKLEHIVARPAKHERRVLDRARLDVDEGLEGDDWRTTDGTRGRQLTLMDARVATAIAERGDWELFGDNLFVSFDLSTDSLRPGDRLRLGGALLEITDEPHLGCRKLASRFGPAALRFVNHKSVRAQRRRGIYAQVLEGGEIAIGDVLTRA